MQGREKTAGHVVVRVECRVPSLSLQCRKMSENRPSSVKRWKDEEKEKT